MIAETYVTRVWIWTWSRSWVHIFRTCTWTSKWTWWLQTWIFCYCGG